MMSLSFSRSRLAAALAFAGSLAATATAGLAAEDGKIVLQIDGNPGTPFAATCELRSAAGGKTIVNIDEKVPFKTTFDGSGLRCNVTAHSQIEVEAVKGGSRSSSSTSGGSANVKVGS
jgi:hypothetical protein